MPSAYNIAANKYSTCLNKTSTVRHNQLLDNSVFQYIVNLLILLLHWPERQCSTMSHQNVWEGEVEVGPQWLPGPQHMSHHVCPKNRYETWLSLKFNLMKSNVSKWFIICFNLFPSWWEPLWWDSLFSQKTKTTRFQDLRVFAFFLWVFAFSFVFFCEGFFLSRLRRCKHFLAFVSPSPKTCNQSPKFEDQSSIYRYFG